MQILVTHGHAARTRVLQVGRWQLALGVLVLLSAMMLVSGALYHSILVLAARQGWSLPAEIAPRVLTSETQHSKGERYMRKNLDAMARRVGEMQAKLIRLEAAGERVARLAGLKPEEYKAMLEPEVAADAKAGANGSGGPYVPVGSPSMQALQDMLERFDQHSDQRLDLFTLAESHLLEARLKTLLIPSTRPVAAPVGSGFGFRADPFSGRTALHTGLDFAAEAGTPIRAAAGGVVITAQTHSAYGQMLEIDHGNGLVTRYAHASRLLVKPGDLVRRGQHVAAVGSTGRSTGPHLHFEVLVEGVPQNPAKFLAQAQPEPTGVLAEVRTR